jgi:hypothetical protein
MPPLNKVAAIAFGALKTERYTRTQGTAESVVQPAATGARKKLIKSYSIVQVELTSL